jgi:hypothetical protein
MKTHFNNKKSKSDLVRYLLDIQLFLAGHNMTIDEAAEMYSAKEYLTKQKFMFINEFTITQKQHDEWFNIAVKLVMKYFNCSKLQAEYEVKMLDLQSGLRIIRNK